MECSGYGLATYMAAEGVTPEQLAARLGRDDLAIKLRVLARTGEGLDGHLISLLTGVSKGAMTAAAIGAEAGALLFNAYRGGQLPARVSAPLAGELI